MSVQVEWNMHFKRLWSDPSIPSRERKRLLAYVIEDVTLTKLPREGTTKVHVRFKGGQTAALTTAKTPEQVVQLVDQLLDEHIYADIADILNARGLRPGGSARPDKQELTFTARLVRYVVHAYGLRSRYDRLRARGLLTKKELATRIGIHELTLARWVKYGIVKAHAYNSNAWLYEDSPHRPSKHSSRWDRLANRAIAPCVSQSQEQGARVCSEEV
jgi:hypothetical protein